MKEKLRKYKSIFAESAPSDSKMWKVIESGDWPKYAKQRQGYSKVKEYFIENYDANTIKNLIDFFGKAKDALSVKLDSYFENYDYDELNNAETMWLTSNGDSWDDGISNIIGHGQKAYMRIYKDPSILLVERWPINESFSYAIPLESDLTEINYALIEELARISSAILKDKEYYTLLKRQSQDILEYLEWFAEKDLERIKFILANKEMHIDNIERWFNDDFKSLLQSKDSAVLDLKDDIYFFLDTLKKG